MRTKTSLAFIIFGNACQPETPAFRAPTKTTYASITTALFSSVKLIMGNSKGQVAGGDPGAIVMTIIMMIPIRISQ